MTYKRELIQVKWHKRPIGSARGTIFEGEPWVDALFAAETIEEAISIIEQRFNRRIRYKRDCGHFLEELEPLSWDERFGLLDIFDYEFTPIYYVFVTEEMLRPAAITNPIQDPFNTLWSFCAHLTKHGNMLLSTGFSPAHPDSDFERAGILIDRNTHQQSEFFPCDGQAFFNVLCNN